MKDKEKNDIPFHTLVIKCYQHRTDCQKGSLGCDSAGPWTVRTQQNKKVLP
jgi:hypothetical protein